MGACIPQADLTQGTRQVAARLEERELHPASTEEGLDLLLRVAFLAEENFEALAANGTAGQVVEILRNMLDQMPPSIQAPTPEPNSAQQQQGSSQ